MKVAIQGIKGSFHNIAAEQRFGKDIALIESLSFEKTCATVANGQADYGILAIENTTVGSFLNNYTLIKDYGLHIVGEEYLQIRHNLMALPGQKISDIKIVRSQDVALSQCRSFLQQYPHIMTEDVEDTALAAKEISENNIKGVAAVASYRAAEMYGLEMIAEKIETNDQNYTRFLALSKIPNELSNKTNKATVAFRVEHVAGSLVTALNVFKIYGLNLSKIQSVPILGLPYEYMIYVDFTWKNKDDFDKAFKLLKEKTLQLQVFGLYEEGRKNISATAQKPEEIVEPIQAPAVITNKEIEALDWREWIPVKPNAPKNYFLISGPCSAETKEQTLETLHALRNLNMVSMYRAGVWKPRTRAGGFEGNGVKALEWLQQFQEETGEKVTVEVATAQHVRDCLDHGITSLWIGARTSTNPFSVQEIADAIKGTDVSVMVKNPINPELELWVGAIERISKAGIKKLAVIHRGFSVAEKTAYRNYPAWSILIELKNRLPHIPLISDPSHICGKKDLIQEVVQKAIDIGTDGFIIESHINPEKAWTDAAQQLSPSQLEHIIKSVYWKKSEQIQSEHKLDNLRTAIERLDTDILSMLSSRMDIVKQILEYKKYRKMEILQTTQWERVLNDRISKGEKLSLEKEFIEEIFNCIHKESLKTQESVK